MGTRAGYRPPSSTCHQTDSHSPDRIYDTPVAFEALEASHFLTFFTRFFQNLFPCNATISWSFFSTGPPGNLPSLTYEICSRESHSKICRMVTTHNHDHHAFPVSPLMHKTKSSFQKGKQNQRLSSPDLSCQCHSSIARFVKTIISTYTLNPHSTNFLENAMQLKLCDSGFFWIIACMTFTASCCAHIMEHKIRQRRTSQNSSEETHGRDKCLHAISCQAKRNHVILVATFDHQVRKVSLHYNHLSGYTFCPHKCL